MPAMKLPYKNYVILILSLLLLSGCAVVNPASVPSMGGPVKQDFTATIISDPTFPSSYKAAPQLWERTLKEITRLEAVQEQATN